jgi:FeS assembly protein IscX
MKWHDAEDIGFALSEKLPDTDPLTVRFTDLRAMVISLDGFADAPAASNEPILEAIQLAWLDYYHDAHPR